MKVLTILAAILLLLFLLSRMRVGSRVRYAEGRLLVRVRIGPGWFTVYPVKKKEKPPKAKAEKPAEGAGKPRKPAMAKGEAVSLVMDALPVVAEAAGRLKRKIRIDDLKLDLLWSAPEPAACGIGYGAANAAAGMIWPLFEQNFNVKSYRVRTGVDFDRGSPDIRIEAVITITQGQLLTLALGVLWKLFQIWRSHSAAILSTTKQKEAV